MKRSVLSLVVVLASLPAAGYVTADGKKGNIVRMDEGNMAVRSFEK